MSVSNGTPHGVTVGAHKPNGALCLVWFCCYLVLRFHLLDHNPALGEDGHHGASSVADRAGTEHDAGGAEPKAVLVAPNEFNRHFEEAGHVLAGQKLSVIR